MRCRKVRSSLSTYSKGETSSELAAEISKHLDNCCSCRREEEAFRSINKLVKELPALKTSDDFSSRLFQRIAREGHSGKKSKAYFPGRIPRFSSARLASVAAVAVIILAFGISLNLGDGFFIPSTPKYAITNPVDNIDSDDDLYLTVQPTDNPLLNEHKSVSRMIQQFNRWREFSKSLRANSGAEQFIGVPTTASLASANTGKDIRVRPVVKNYLIVPGNSANPKWGAGY